MFGFFTKLFAALSTPVAVQKAQTKAPTIVKPVQTTPAPQKTIRDFTVYNQSTIGVEDIYDIAVYLVNTYPELREADPKMAAIMAITEAGGNSPIINLKASRYEPAFHRNYVSSKPASYATSYGPLQLLLQTAVETYNAGFRSLGYPSPEVLKNPVSGTYFGLAYQVRIRQYAGKRGVVPTDAYVVMSYNGGFGANNADTQNHYKKYVENTSVLNNAIA